jgi:peptidase M49-like protein
MGTLLALMLAGSVPDLAQLNRMIARFAPVELKVDLGGLSPGDRQALVKLIEAARLFNELYMRQLWPGNPALWAKLQQDSTPLGKARQHYYWINKAPWSELDAHTAFLPGVPAKKPLGANFYPEDMTREQFESWVKPLSRAEREKAEGFFTVIRRDAFGKLTAVPYSREYAAELQRCAQLLREAAKLTGNESLRRFLTTRADAFLSDDYYASDVAWMDLDAPLDVTIGPYETYTDELFGYKAAFEAYILLRDEKETARLKYFADHLQDVENNLPIEPRYRNRKLGALAPIRVVNEIFSAGDGAHSVQSAAYNLPNDERVVKEKGSKRVMLKNIQEAKFRANLVPIASRMLAKPAQADLSFDAFFTHIVAHEMSHGIGPHQIRVGGRDTTPRQELKELYSAIEEAKADVTGLFMLGYLAEHGLKEAALAERPLYTTYLASSFRSVRFGIHEAHGRGMAMQFNYFLDHGAFHASSDGTFAVDIPKMKAAVTSLAHELLTIEAHGDYAAAKKMLETLAVIRPPLQAALDHLQDIPTDIEPVYTTADMLTHTRRHPWAD